MGLITAPSARVDTYIIDLDGTVQPFTLDTTIWSSYFLLEADDQNADTVYIGMADALDAAPGDITRITAIMRLAPGQSRPLPLEKVSQKGDVGFQLSRLYAKGAATDFVTAIRARRI